MARTSTKIKVVDDAGNVASQSLIEGYEIANRDENIGAVSYYGYIDADGNWYIQRENDATGDSDFVAGTSAYSTNWTGRTGLSYAKFDAVF